MRRTGVWIAVAMVAALIGATVSWTSGVTLLILDDRGVPAPDAYVQFHYEGYLINPVHPVTYASGGSAIVRPDPSGRVVIPARIHFRRPLPLSMPPAVSIDHVYVPRLHNAFGPIAAMTGSRPGVFEIDERRERVTVADVGESPERWEMSLRYLLDAIRATVSTTGAIAPAEPDDSSTRAHARELIGHLRSEYEAFLAEHGAASRERPAPPPGMADADRAAWQSQTEAQLDREPLWGPFMERLWQDDLKELAALEARLP